MAIQGMGAGAGIGMAGYPAMGIIPGMGAIWAGICVLSGISQGKPCAGRPKGMTGWGIAATGACMGMPP